jgi:acetylornithine/succinyldiaminopimelate/putrescine aminotransferase
VVDVRGTGLLLGLELDGPAAPLAEDMMKKGYLVTVVQERTLRFTPPLTISEEDMNSMLSALSDTLHNSGGNPA